VIGKIGGLILDQKWGWFCMGDFWAPLFLGQKCGWAFKKRTIFAKKTTKSSQKFKKSGEKKKN
jgi:hypothetical protein